MSERRCPEATFELPVEVLLASIPYEHRHRLNLDALADERGRVVEADPRQPLAHRDADLAPEHGAQVGPLPVEVGGEPMQGDRFRIRLFDAIQHATNVHLCG